MVKETSEHEITDHDDVSTKKSPLMLTSHEKNIKMESKKCILNFLFLKLIVSNKFLK